MFYMYMQCRDMANNLFFFCLSSFRIDPVHLPPQPLGRLGTGIPPYIQSPQIQLAPRFHHRQSGEGEVRMIWIWIISRFLPKTPHGRLGREEERVVRFFVQEVIMAEYLELHFGAEFRDETY